MDKMLANVAIFLQILLLSAYATASSINLTTACAGEQLYSCILTDLRSLIDDPLDIANSKAPHLKELIIHHSHIQRIPRDIFELVPAVKSFRLYKCQVNRMRPEDLRAASNLEELQVQGTPLSELPERVFNQSAKLTTLKFGDNRLSLVNRKAFAGLKLLRHLDMHGNSIETLPLGVFDELIALEHIDLSGNRLEKIDGETFRKNSNLRTVLLNGNAFRVFEPNALEHLPLLYLLDLSGVKGLNELYLQSVDMLKVEGSGLEQLNVTKVISLQASNNKLTTLSIGDELAVREIDLEGNLFSSLDPLMGMKNLQKLTLSKNILKSLNVSESPLVLNLPALRYLDLSFNQLKSIGNLEFLLLSKLSHLDLAFNHLTSLPPDLLEPLVALEHLYIEGNYLQQIDYEGLLHVRNTLREIGLSDSEWDVRHQADLLDFFQKHDISLPVRYTQAVTHTSLGGSRVATSKSLYDLRKVGWNNGDRPQQQQAQQVGEVTGIHPYWTTRDILAFCTLLVCLFILILQLCRIIREEQCFARCCDRVRYGQVDNSREPLNDAENYTEL